MASGKLIMQFASSTALIGREKGATQPDTQTSASSIWIRRAEKTPSASITMGTPSTQPLPPLHEMLAGETRLPRFEDLLTSASTPRKPPTSSHSADLPIKQGEPSASGHSTDARETTLPLQTSKNATPSSESNSISGESSFARATSEESNRVIPAKRLLQRWNSRPLLQQNSFRSMAVMQSEPLNMPEIGWFSSTWHLVGDIEPSLGSRRKTFTCTDNCYGACSGTSILDNALWRACGSLGANRPHSRGRSAQRLAHRALQRSRRSGPLTCCRPFGPASNRPALRRLRPTEGRFMA